MPWKESCVMDERMKFIVECKSGEYSMAELCRGYGINRRTGYKWLARYESEGPCGLSDRSRRPHCNPTKIDDDIVNIIIECKGEHMLWGPKKIRAVLYGRSPEIVWPAVSTIGDILNRHGLVVHRRRRNRATPSAQPLEHCQAANHVWCIDFKGWFRTQNGRRCTPLTLSDGYSRFLLRCQSMSGNTGFEQVKPLLVAAFREFGLPYAIRSDNGAPFASVGLAGLSVLSVWWMRLGIRPERIWPGKPQENGRHERMHRTLKEATAKPPKATLKEQQQAFDRFVHEYNFERPHEALGQQPPAHFYQASPRSYPSRLPKMPEYPKDFIVRKIKDSGRIKWKGNELCLCSALTGQYVGFEQIEERLYRIYFMDQPIGYFDEKHLKVKPLSKKTKKRALRSKGTT